MANVTRSRPLSPHLQIYKPIPTMVMSILHRITGVALYFGTILVVAWLIAVASGEARYNSISWIFGTIPALLVLFGYSWALFHHMLGGIRHFMWDMGHGYEKSFSTKLAIGNMIGSICLTVLLWVVIYLVRF